MYIFLTTLACIFIGWNFDSTEKAIIEFFDNF